MTGLNFSGCFANRVAFTAQCRQYIHLIAVIDSAPIGMIGEGGRGLKSGGAIAFQNGGTGLAGSFQLGFGPKV
jgi:hypothetical protein